MIILGEAGLIDNEVETRVKRSLESKSLEVLIRGVRLRDVWPNLSLVYLTDKAMLLSEAPVDRAPTMHTHMFDTSVVIDELATGVFDPDGTRAWARKLERRHAELRNINTVEDCVIDSFNNVLTCAEGKRIRDRLMIVLRDPEIVSIFEGTTGNVIGDEFLIRAKIDPDRSDRSPKAAPQGYGKNLPESVLRGIEEKLDDGAAEGVLIKNHP